MQYPSAPQLCLPIEPYELKDGVYQFGTRVRSRLILWARHLGDDVVAEPGTPVVAIGDGQAVWAAVRAGSEKKRNWGGLVVLAHDTFYSVYGHITDITVKVGERVDSGQQIGVVAAGNTPENGWWKIPHLHFGIYVGPWTNEILPGYKRPGDKRTQFTWWRDPRPFIEDYNRAGEETAAALS